MKHGFSYRIKITPSGPLQKFNDKAIDLTKRGRKTKKTNPKRTRTKSR